MGEIKFITGLVFASLFAIAIFGYAIGYADDNDAVVSLENNTRFDGLKTQMEGNMSEFRKDVENSSDAFYKSEITTGDETTRTGGQFKVGSVSAYNSFQSVVSVVKQDIFGGSASFGIFTTALVSLFTYIGIRYIWKTWKGGNPD